MMMMIRGQEEDTQKRVSPHLRFLQVVMVGDSTILGGLKFGLEQSGLDSRLGRNQIVGDGQG